MRNIVKYLTFIPWILYFIEIMLYRIGVLEDMKLKKDDYFKHLNENLFSSINVKELVLFLIFIIFTQWKNTAVLEVLFSTFYIYLLIDFFGSVAKYCKKIKHKSLMVQSVILLSIIIIFFMSTNKLYTTYILMFSSSILSSFIIYLFGNITSKFLPKSLKK